MPSLTCSVSLLVKFEPAQNYKDWVIGVHGIRIEYKQNGHRLNAVFLPEVALEQSKKLFFKIKVFLFFFKSYKMF